MIRNALVEPVNRSPTIDGQVYDAVGIPFKSGLIFNTYSVGVKHAKEIVVKPEDDHNRDRQSVRNCRDENEREHNTHGKN
jgi:hypothetical protein